MHKHGKKTSISVISQYAAQVTASQERIGWIQNKFRYMEEFFPSIKIQIVDSFQRDEKDIIIL